MEFVEKDNSLFAEFTFKDFKEAFAFMTEVAFHCEKQNHHPNWENVYNVISIKLSTHDAGNTVTEKDHKLSEAILKVYTKYLG